MVKKQETMKKKRDETKTQGTNRTNEKRKNRLKKMKIFS